MQKPEFTNVLNAALARLLESLARLLIRNGMSFPVFAEIAKRAYVNVARDDFAIPGKPQTNTRIATLTGLSRKEVLRIINLQLDGEDLLTARHNRATRVISAWIRLKAFHDRRGKPAALPFEGTGQSFMTLVKQSSGDIPARTILDELLHSGSVRYLKDGRIKLVGNAYIPSGDVLAKMRMLGTDVSDLICTIDHNLATGDGDSFFQRKVSYNNIPDEHIELLKNVIVTRAQQALEDMNREMVRHDRDGNPAVAGTGRRRAGISIFYFEEDLDDDGDSA